MQVRPNCGTHKWVPYFKQGKLIIATSRIKLNVILIHKHLPYTLSGKSMYRNVES